MDKNSLRDELENCFRNYLVDCIPGNADTVNEAVCDLTNIAFDVIGIEQKEQELTYCRWE